MAGLACDWEDEVAIRVEHTLVINRPVEEVFALVTDVESFPRWTESIIEAVKTSEGPVELGTTCRIVNKAMGRQLDHSFVVTQYELNKVYAVKSTAGPFPMEMCYTVESVEGGTRLHVESEADPRGAMRLAGPMLNRMLKKQITADHANLKALLESSA